jgi:hypothetical protein
MALPGSGSVHYIALLFVSSRESNGLVAFDLCGNSIRIAHSLQHRFQTHSLEIASAVKQACVWNVTLQCDCYTARI